MTGGTGLTERALLFPLRPVIALAEHAVAATAHRPTFLQHEEGVSEAPPALFWVKDDGTYLSSNGLPRPEGVVYASTADGLHLRSVDPRAEPELWAQVRAATELICGGDDFVEDFELLSDDALLDGMRAALRDGFTHLELRVGPDTVSLGFSGPPLPAPAPPD